MGAKILQTVFKPSLNFLRNGPDKISLGIFEILKIEILAIFAIIATRTDDGRTATEDGRTLISSALLT